MSWGLGGAGEGELGEGSAACVGHCTCGPMPAVKSRAEELPESTPWSVHCLLAV